MVLKFRFQIATSLPLLAMTYYYEAPRPVVISNGQRKCQSGKTDILSCYFTENLYTQLCVYVSPGFRSVDGKLLWFGVSGYF